MTSVGPEKQPKKKTGGVKQWVRTFTGQRYNDRNAYPSIPRLVFHRFCVTAEEKQQMALEEGGASAGVGRLVLDARFHALLCSQLNAVWPKANVKQLGDPESLYVRIPKTGEAYQGVMALLQRFEQENSAFVRHLRNGCPQSALVTVNPFFLWGLVLKQASKFSALWFCTQVDCDLGDTMCQIPLSNLAAFGVNRRVFASGLFPAAVKLAPLVCRRFPLSLLSAGSLGAEVPSNTLVAAAAGGGIKVFGLPSPGRRSGSSRTCEDDSDFSCEDGDEDAEAGAEDLDDDTDDDDESGSYTGGDSGGEGGGPKRKRRATDGSGKRRAGGQKRRGQGVSEPGAPRGGKDKKGQAVAGAGTSDRGACVVRGAGGGRGGKATGSSGVGVNRAPRAPPSVPGSGIRVPEGGFPKPNQGRDAVAVPVAAVATESGGGGDAGLPALPQGQDALQKFLTEFSALPVQGQVAIAKGVMESIRDNLGDHQAVFDRVAADLSLFPITRDVYNHALVFKERPIFPPQCGGSAADYLEKIFTSYAALMPPWGGFDLYVKQCILQQGKPLPKIITELFRNGQYYTLTRDHELVTMAINGFKGCAFLLYAFFKQLQNERTLDVWVGAVRTAVKMRHSMVMVADFGWNFLVAGAVFDVETRTFLALDEQARFRQHATPALREAYNRIIDEEMGRGGSPLSLARSRAAFLVHRDHPDMKLLFANGPPEKILFHGKAVDFYRRHLYKDPGPIEERVFPKGRLVPAHVLNSRQASLRVREEDFYGFEPYAGPREEAAPAQAGRRRNK